MTQTTMTEIAQELAGALDMLLKVATDERARLPGRREARTRPKGELYTDMVINGARAALAKAKAVGLLPRSEMVDSKSTTSATMLDETRANLRADGTNPTPKREIGA